MFRCFNSYLSSTNARLNILTSKAGKVPPKGHGHGLISRRKRRSISSSSSHPSVSRCVAQGRAQNYLACLLNLTGCLHWNWPRSRGHGLPGVRLRGHIGPTLLWGGTAYDFSFQGDYQGGRYSIILVVKYGRWLESHSHAISEPDLFNRRGEGQYLPSL